MRKGAVIFVVAVLLPSLVLAGLALRAVRDQQFVLERQEAVLAQDTADALAGRVRDLMAQQQLEFAGIVDEMAAGRDAEQLASGFDEALRRRWGLAAVGFAVTLDGRLLSPSATGRPEARRFLDQNKVFLVGDAPAVVYAPGAASGYADEEVAQQQSLAAKAVEILAYRSLKGGKAGPEKKERSALAQAESRAEPAPPAAPPAPAVAPVPEEPPAADSMAGATGMVLNAPTSAPEAAEDRAAEASLRDDKQREAEDFQRGAAESPAQDLREDDGAKSKSLRQDKDLLDQSSADSLAPRARNVMPQRAMQKNAPLASQIVPSRAEFSEVIGDGLNGLVARFVGDDLSVVVWYRMPADPGIVFGAELRLAELRGPLLALMAPKGRSDYEAEWASAILDAEGKPWAVVPGPFADANWRRPLVAAEIGEYLPRWEVAILPVDPGAAARTAANLRVTFFAMIAVMVGAITAGGLLILRDINREMRLARQKTDFVSNVSHELKTPLTSIRMFSELLAEERVTDPAKRRNYLGIISAEAARLTRLINNVLDFSRMERREKKYEMRPLDLGELVVDTVENYRPHLEANGYRLEVVRGPGDLHMEGDPDALAQVVLNLVSNAEKYGGDRKDVRVEVGRQGGEGPAEVRVSDRGDGVPAGAEEKIFEQFYRAHDSLSSGIQGSGLGLTLARQIAQAHGGDVTYLPRDGGGSTFVLSLPLQRAAAHTRTPETESLGARRGSGS